MKQALLLHGWEWNWNNHWFPWLKKHLQAKWYTVYNPNLLSADYPEIEEQLLDIQDIQLEKWDSIIWHSLGCQLWLKYIEKHKLQDLRIIFVAPSYNSLADEIGEPVLWNAFMSVSTYFDTQYDFHELNKLWNSYTVFLSEDDPYINNFSAKEFYSQIENINFVSFKNRWHFNTSAWITELPDIDEYI